MIRRGSAISCWSWLRRSCLSFALFLVGTFWWVCQNHHYKEWTLRFNVFLILHILTNTLYHWVHVHSFLFIHLFKSVKTLRMMPNLHQLRLQNNLLQHVYDIRDYITSSRLSMLIENNPLHCMGSLCWLQEVKTTSCSERLKKCMLKQEVQRHDGKKKVGTMTCYEIQFS